MLIGRLLGLALFAAASMAPAPAAQSALPIETFFAAASADAKIAEPALDAIGRNWRQGYTSMLVDLARFMVPARPSSSQSGDPFDRRLTLPDEFASRFGESGPPEPSAAGPAGRPSAARARLIRLLEARTGRRFGNDLAKWRDWMWQLPYEPHPDAMRFKAELYARVDPRMRQFFTGQALIRLDEIDWGGVKVNGIPPLSAPAAIRASAATFLDDKHIVFGVVAGGKARAYPKRILAWHEMALDTLGGVRLTVVYCTLCGTVIPYLSTVDGRPRTFGTSGLLYRSNKLMFDEESNTLWSTLEGRPVVGPLAGGNTRLDFLPVVTTTWGEWRKAHPETTVLAIPAGFERDYSEGAAYREYFSSDRLMFRVPRPDGRLSNKDEVLGLNVDALGGGRQAVAFSVAFLKKHRVYQTTMEGTSIVVLTTPGGANRAYAAGATRFVRWSGDARVIDDRGGIWEVTEADLIRAGGGSDSPRPRLPAFRAFWFGWVAQFPDTELVK